MYDLSLLFCSTIESDEQSTIGTFLEFIFFLL